jgi:hypothetical protein
LEFVLEPSFFASVENILPVRLVREEEKREGK